MEIDLEWIGAEVNGEAGLELMRECTVLAWRVEILSRIKTPTPENFAEVEAIGERARELKSIGERLKARGGKACE